MLSKPFSLALTAIAVVTIAPALYAQDIKHTVATQPWNTDSLGDHRVVLTVAGNAPVAKAHIEWRRRDNNPSAKRIIIEDATTKRRILNAAAANVSRESGDIFFEPVSGKGTYYVYYLPSKNEGRNNYPKGVYLKADTTASQLWLDKVKAGGAIAATVKEIQAVDTFNAFTPMEIIATAAETKKIAATNAGKAFVLFPEDRTMPIRMQHDLPYRWIKNNAGNTFSGTAKRGENYAWQIGVFALQDLQNVQVRFSDLKSNGGVIAAKDITCINTNGVTYDAKPFAKTVNVHQQDIQALWNVIAVAESAKPGIYTGKATVTANGQSTDINVRLTVQNEIAKDGGINEPWLQTRLPWLNSTLAQENTVVAPYTPLEVKDNVISLLGRKVEVNKDGLPKQIQTFFTPEMTAYADTATNLLYEGIHFHFVKASNGKDVKWTKSDMQFTKKEAGTVAWKAVNSTDSLQMDVDGSLEFDGFAKFTIKVTALEDIAFKDVTFHFAFMPAIANYMMGLGQKGGLRPEQVDWKWNVKEKNQDAVWIGDVNAGLYYQLYDEHYTRPLNTNFYLQKPLVEPASWSNGGKGGITVGIKGKSMLANNYTGPRAMKKGDVLYYNFSLLITPFHILNTDFQWSNRFYHKYNNLDTIAATGATVVNIHHATPINPWINYPFIEYKKMKAYIDEAHRKGLKVKIYNTVRELSNHAYELPALRSLEHEVYSPGKGGGYRWLQEHLDSDYIAAWFVPEIKDAAIINSGMNRWHNYYVEGMNWLTKNIGIDGIYLDDVAFDRVTMKRIKRVLTQDGHPGIIDLHSANQYNKSDGFNNSAILYLEHFPYLNRLWFGEYFDYENNGPDFFLTEVSGIPFGLMGEMLQNGGNPWRGMIYGMTNRLGWTDVNDPRPLWEVWKRFGIEGSQLIGYWSPNCPVKTNNSKVLATVYKNNGKLLIALASWAAEDTNVQLQIDWAKLGVAPATTKIIAPAIKGFQEGKTFDLGENIPVTKGKGWLLELTVPNLLKDKRIMK